MSTQLNPHAIPFTPSWKVIDNELNPNAHPFIVKKFKFSPTSTGKKLKKVFEAQKKRGPVPKMVYITDGEHKGKYAYYLFSVHRDGNRFWWLELATCSTICDVEPIQTIPLFDPPPYEP
tara:strand:- start:368 stop:724 length:357 start_codon:yes stop_codon:yes gene_type:complete